MAEPLGRAETRELLERHGVRPKRRLGQHFVVEPNVVRRIVQIAKLGSDSQVVEIGAGVGTLTRSLVAAARRVIAFEVDVALQPVLEETVGEAAELRFDDAAHVDFNRLPAGGWTLVANLPYNVGTPIVLTILQTVPRVERLVVMLQREAVDRLVAEPGSRTYGIPSVITSLHATASRELRVPPNAFYPRPQVESAVVLLDRTDPHPDAAMAITLASAAFGQRRKMLRSSLRRVLRDPLETLGEAGIEPTRRAEDLAPSDYLKLAAAAA